jgi:ABC-type phosphate transport system substrate-binding protein
VVLIGASLVGPVVSSSAGPDALAQAPSAPASSSQEAYRLIVDPANSTTSVDRVFVAQAFLKKVRRWPDGGTIHPVDLARGSPIRSRWSSDVLSRSVDAVKIYWQQMIFSGRELPPPEMGSDDEVVDYVLRRPGSIGYVSASTNLRGTKVLTVR